MAINYQLQSKSGAPNESFPFIFPGEARAILDYPKAKKQILVVHCLPHDIGGCVYAPDIEANHNDLIPVRLLKDEDQIEYIPPGGSYSKEIITRQKKRYVLVARHIGKHSFLLARDELKRVPLPTRWNYLREG